MRAAGGYMSTRTPWLSRNSIPTSFKLVPLLFRLFSTFGGGQSIPRFSYFQSFFTSRDAEIVPFFFSSNTHDPSRPDRLFSQTRAMFVILLFGLYFANLATPLLVRPSPSIGNPPQSIKAAGTTFFNKQSALFFTNLPTRRNSYSGWYPEGRTPP